VSDSGDTDELFVELMARRRRRLKDRVIADGERAILLISRDRSTRKEKRIPARNACTRVRARLMNILRRARALALMAFY